MPYILCFVADWRSHFDRWGWSVSQLESGSRVRYRFAYGSGLAKPFRPMVLRCSLHFQRRYQRAKKDQLCFARITDGL